MNKIMKKILTLSLIITAISITSCSGVIFDSIRDEVKLADAQITADVCSIFRVYDASDSNEYLYVTAGTLWKKNINEATTEGTDTDKDGDGVSTSKSGCWKKATKPEGLLNSGASNANGEIYVVSATNGTVDNETVPDTSTVYWYNTAAPDDGWKIVQFADSSKGTDVTKTSSSESQIFMIIGTNTPKKSHRHVFLNLAGTVYKLENGVATEYTSGNFTDVDNSTDISSTVCSVATFDGSSFYFSDEYGLTTDENINNDATKMYLPSGNYIYYRSSSDSEWSKSSSNSSFSGTLAATFTTSGIILGTESGHEVALLDDEGIPTGETDSLPNNGKNTLNGYYEVWNMVAIDPSKTWTGTDIYASIDFEGSSSSTSATSQNCGLWAYYPSPNRNSWNRE